MSFKTFLNWFVVTTVLTWPLIVGAQKQKFFTPQIAIKMTLSGDMSNVYQFSGPLGSALKGEPEKSDGACENTSTFHQVIYQKKRSIQIWMTLKCSISGQIFEFRPQRFFMDAAATEQTFSLPAQSENFRKISMVLSDVQIKDSMKKK